MITVGGSVWLLTACLIYQALGPSLRAPSRLELNAQADAIRLKKALTLFSAPEGQQGCSVVVRYHNNNASCELKLPPHCKVRPDDALLALIQSEFQGSQAEVVYN